MSETKRDWEGFVSQIREEASEIGVGRPSLRRRWANVKSLAAQAVASIHHGDIEELLGKSVSKLDPAENDLKAVVAFAMGRGTISNPHALAEAIEQDNDADPLSFLAQLSGKSFGETWAPRIANYWLVDSDDKWEKKRSTEYYDVGWFPQELGGDEIRIELKSSSEHPEFRFQQIRHPRLSGEAAKDYDVLLCLGVTAGSLEWWSIPVDDFSLMADNGVVSDDEVVITKQHGKRETIWNDEVGYQLEGWYQSDERCRGLLEEYTSSSEALRNIVLNSR